jgi:hypothetical protein
MNGPSNRVPSDATQIETALAYTAPGQATWADPSIPIPAAIALIGSCLRDGGKTWVVASNSRRGCEACTGRRSRDGSRRAARSSLPQRRGRNE